MNKYKAYVDIIQAVTELRVPVIYDDKEADCINGAYAGFLGYEDIIAPSLYETAMFEFEDYLEPEHVQYYHIGLPSQICNGASYRKEGYALVGDMLSEMSITDTTENVEVFIILHEFGHATVNPQSRKQIEQSNLLDLFALLLIFRYVIKGSPI